MEISGGVHAAGEASLEDAKEESTRRMLQLLTGAWTTQALRTAAELGIADLLDSQSATTAELVTSTDADPDLLHRLLRYLASLGVVRRDDERWSLTELGRTLRTGALRDVARLYGGLFYESFGSLPHSVRTGENAFEHALGMPPFAYLNHHPDQACVFHGAMAAGSSWFSRVPEVIDFTGAGTVVDVAGGHGGLLRHILAAAPEMHDDPRRGVAHLTMASGPTRRCYYPCSSSSSPVSAPGVRRARDSTRSLEGWRYVDRSPGGRDRFRGPRRRRRARVVHRPRHRTAHTRL